MLIDVDLTSARYNHPTHTTVLNTSWDLLLALVTLKLLDRLATTIVASATTVLPFLQSLLLALSVKSDLVLLDALSSRRLSFLATGVTRLGAEYLAADNVGRRRLGFGGLGSCLLGFRDRLIFIFALLSA